MSSRPKPERLYQARRSAFLERLVSAGMLRERAEAAVVATERRDGPVKDWESLWRLLRPS